MRSSPRATRSGCSRASGRLVLVTEVDGLRNRDDRMAGGWKAADIEAVVSYLAAPAPDTLLALVAEDLKKDSPLGKACAKAGEILVYEAEKKKLVALRYRAVPRPWCQGATRCLPAPPRPCRREHGRAAARGGKARALGRGRRDLCRPRRGDGAAAGAGEAVDARPTRGEHATFPRCSRPPNGCSVGVRRRAGSHGAPRRPGHARERMQRVCGRGHPPTRSRKAAQAPQRVSCAEGVRPGGELGSRRAVERDDSSRRARRRAQGRQPHAGRLELVRALVDATRSVDRH